MILSSVATYLKLGGGIYVSYKTDMPDNSSMMKHVWRIFNSLLFLDRVSTYTE